jgi:thiol-disulfide isomerase/thioredoxin
MKYHLSTLLCLVNLLASSLLSAQERYLIQGEIAGLKKQHTHAYLTLASKDTHGRADSAEVVKGKFTFSGTVAEPGLYTIRVKNLPGAVSLILENTVIHLKADAKDMSKARISGSALSDERTAYQLTYVAPALEEMARNATSASAFLTKGDSVQAAAYYKKNHYIRLRQNSIAGQYIREHPQSYQSLLLLDTLWGEFGYENTKKYLQTIPVSLQNHSTARRILAEVEARIIREAALSIGATAPEFSQPDTTDIPVPVSAFRGKYLLIDFWASWCGPCREGHPELVQIYQKYQPYGLEIMSISLDDDREKWLQAIKKDQLLWTQVSDLKGWKNHAALLYDINFVPYNYLIDPEGKIINKYLRVGALEWQLKKIFARPGN